MIFNIGYLLLITALLLSIFGIVTGYLGGQRRDPRLIQSSFNGIVAVAGLLVVASIILWYGLLTDKFQVVYIWNHSERSLPVGYKFSAIWGGQQGSLLFWCLVLAIYSLAAVLSIRSKHAAILPYFYAALHSSALFFLILLVFAANPFRMVGFVPEDGQGLNPLLQNYWMVIHPVMLYFGYVGMAVPFSFAVGALISKQLDSSWVRTIRRWTLIPWMFLSAGIIMGSQWAYMELGWGGYWAWDPVENASFLPWLTGTAFLHSVIIQEQRGILKVWNMILVWSTYFLVILGTFTTRSGVLESVHSFARSDVGPYFVAYMIIMLLGFIYLLYTRLPLLQGENQIDGVVSRESAFLANNWLFAGITFATLWGTFFPMFSEILTGDRISVAAPWFNKVVGPLFLVLLLLMGVGPLLGWRFTSTEALRRQFTWPSLFSIVMAAAMFFFTTNIYPIIGMAICFFVLVTIIQEYVRGILARRRHNDESIPVAMSQLIRRNGRRYGGYIVHLGIVLIGVAVLGNEFFQHTTNVTLAKGESVELAGYTLVYTGLESEREGNHVRIGARLDVFDAETDRKLSSVLPQRNIYDKNPDVPTSEVGIRMTPLEDVYVVINGWDNSGDSATFTIFVNPLTMWMWVGGLVIVLGVVLAIWPNPSQRAAFNREASYVPAAAGD